MYGNDIEKCGKKLFYFSSIADSHFRRVLTAFQTLCIFYRCLCDKVLSNHFVQVLSLKGTEGLYKRFECLKNFNGFI